jgi:hypothetical protein
LLFDTHDVPKTKKITFDQQLDQIKLTSIMKLKTVQHLSDNYKLFIESLALKYKLCEKIKNFPLYKIKNVSPNGKVFFDDESLLPKSTEEMTLKHIALVVSFSLQDNQIPLETKESFELFRRSPTLWAYNPNKSSYTTIDRTKKV